MDAHKTPETMDIEVFEAPSGERLDIAISVALGVSRTYAKTLVNDGFVQLDGRPVAKASYKLGGRELVSVVLPPPKPMRVEPEALDLSIIYEDDMLAAISKPPGMTAHPTASVRTGTVVNALLARMNLAKEKSFDPEAEDYRPGIVHRLDKDTSGVMVVAKTSEAHRALSAAFKKRLTEKDYIAIAVGTLDDDLYMDAPIGRHPLHGRKMTVGGSNPRSATTYFRVLARHRQALLVAAKPHTGRTHQIRVHLAHLGAPILGDGLYGTTSSLITRHALHAHRLSVPHPNDNEAISFEAHVPVDMIDAWLRLGGTWPAAEGLE